MGHPITPRPFGRRRPVEGSGTAVAVACVATALLLYFASTLVFDFDEDAGDAVFISMRVR